MKRAVLLALAGAVALTACDEGPNETFELSLVDRTRRFDRIYMKAGMPLVSLNAPFPGVSPERTTGMIRLPESFGENRGLSDAPKETAPSEGKRLVVAYNLRTPALAEKLCEIGAERRDLDPLDKHLLTADLALCDGEEPMAWGSVLARTDARGGTAEFAATAISMLLRGVAGTLEERRALEQRDGF